MFLQTFYCFNKMFVLMFIGLIILSINIKLVYLMSGEK